MSREYFNQQAENWDEKVEHDGEKIRRVLAGLPDFSKPEILDVGSGTGILIPFLRKRYGENASITEIDFAAKMIAKAREKYSNLDNIKYITGNIYEQRLPENNYELIICYSAFPHMTDREAFFSKLYRLLTEKGRLVILHSQSRAAINALHENSGAEVARDHLPPAADVAVLAETTGFNAEKTVDNDQLYVVVLKKPEPVK